MEFVHASGATHIINLLQANADRRSQMVQRIASRSVPYNKKSEKWGILGLHDVPFR